MAITIDKVTIDLKKYSERELAVLAEAYETPRWAADAILEKELMTATVVDPCAGKGVLLDAARAAGYDAVGYDKFDWGRPDIAIKDFFKMDRDLIMDHTVFMNPPFSKSEDFVIRAIKAKARKIVCFQRFAWWESAKREKFWNEHPPNRVYICGNRASCWRFDIPREQRASSTTTAHAWFVWERGHPAGTIMGHVYKSGDK